MAICFFFLVGDYTQSPVYAGLIFGGYFFFLLFCVLWWLSRHLVASFLWRSAFSMLVEELVEDFGKVPLPRLGQVISAEDYFSTIASDPDVPCTVRMAAAGHGLRISEFARQQGLGYPRRIAKLYKVALSEYCAASSS
jgi:hypothetical protein